MAQWWTKPPLIVAALGILAVILTTLLPRATITQHVLCQKGLPFSPERTSGRIFYHLMHGMSANAPAGPFLVFSAALARSVL